MAFARDNDDVSWLGFVQRRFNRFRAIGSTDVRVSKRRRRPTSASLMIDERIFRTGLSDVTTTKSLASAAAIPISGRLVRSRSPPQPNTVMTRSLVKLRAVAMVFRSASSVCA